ncbi:MAG: hypothetical protein ACFFDW_03380 [Candidatus Thorarchaeota archaeon]
MDYQNQLLDAQKFENEGKNIEAAKIYEDVGTKLLREGSEEEKREASKIIAKSIARYLLSDNTAKAQDLAYQVLFLKDSDPFLSLQIESAISPKNQLIRGYIVKSIPKELDENHEIFAKVPQNRKIMRISNEVTIKSLWEGTIFGPYVKKYDLVDQKFPNPKNMINFILSTKTGISIVGAETSSSEKMIILIADTFNKDPVEVLYPKEV